MTLENTVPQRVQRRVRSKLEIISSESPAEVQEAYDKFVNHIMTFGAIIGYPYFSTAAGKDYVEYTAWIRYEVPIAVTDEMIQEAYTV